MELGRYQGFDHFGLDTDDFDATLARIEAAGVDIWAGPLEAEGMRIVFINGARQRQDRADGEEVTAPFRTSA